MNSPTSLLLLVNILTLSKFSVPQTLYDSRKSGRGKWMLLEILQQEISGSVAKKGYFGFYRPNVDDVSHIN